MYQWNTGSHRIVTGNDSGEITFWDGSLFAYITHSQASSNGAITSMEWTHDERYISVAVSNGEVQLHEPTINNLQNWRAHDRSVMDMSWAPSGYKLVTCSEDNTVRIWDIETIKQGAEQQLEGHGSSVHTIDWHPYSSLIASGSRDSQVMFWDARVGKPLHTR